MAIHLQRAVGKAADLLNGQLPIRERAQYCPAAFRANIKARYCEVDMAFPIELWCRATIGLYS